MADIKELFDMVTKPSEPDLDSWKEQEDRQRKRSRQHKIGAFAVAAAFVAVAAIAFASMSGDSDDRAPAGGTESPPPVATDSYLNIATGERTPVAANLFGARLAEVSPNGEAIVFGTCCTGTDAIFVTRLDGTNDRTKFTAGGPNGYGATWIDNETILFQGREADSIKIGDLYTADIATGEVSLLVDLPDLKTGAWIVVSDVSPDGSTVLYHLPRGKGENVTWDLWTVPITGGQPTLLREDAGYAQYASDGSIVFLGDPFPFAGNELWITDSDGGHARVLVDGDDTLTWPRVSPDGTMVTYGNDGAVEVVDIATREVTRLNTTGEEPAWYGNDTLIVD